MKVWRFLLGGLVNPKGKCTALAIAFNPRTLWWARRCYPLVSQPGGRRHQGVVSTVSM